MSKRVLTFIGAMAIASAAFAAPQQTAKPPAKPVASKPAEKTADAKPEPAQKAPPEPGMPLNIRIEVSITDQTGQGPAAKKVVTMIAGDRQVTSIRSSASVPVRLAGMAAPAPPSYRNVTINVDAHPTILAKEPTKVMVSFGLEYQPKSRGESEEMEPGMASVSERLSLILESGKPVVVSQAADPTSDRKITVEVTATILK
jgi:hypothetical protein